MTGITMYDSVNITQIPAGAQAVAGYVDGRFANLAELRDKFPAAHVLSIAVNAAHDADCLDIEQGDATPAQAAAWFLRQKARGITRPCLYASAFVMDTEVIPALKAAGIGAGEIRLWSAHYTGTAHICGPSTCRELGVSADGTQWTDKAMGRNLDQSLLAAGFFGAVPPANWQETLMNKLPTLQQGAVDKAGQVFFVHRMQALVKVYGEISGMGTVACQMVTGTFDAATKTAVEAIQVSRKLTADGIVGPQTWGVLIAGSAT
jgi:peptidoglycan hydrolase-like protein with peptidoglycan-binding domain